MIKISIVTVTYNCADIIKETLLSVLSQDYDNIDYVIVDGNSSDGTVRIINDIIESECKCESFTLNHPYFTYKFTSEPDKGIFDAMNKSLIYTKGEYVLFMNAGDKFVNNHIISDIFANKEHTEDLIYGDTYVQNSLGLILRKADPIYLKNPSPFQMVFESQGFCHQSLFTKTEVLRKVKFNLAFPIGADYDTTAKVFKIGNRKLYYTGFAVSIFDDRTGGASHDKEMKVLMERVEMFGLKKNLSFYIMLYKNLMVKRIKIVIQKLFPTFINKYRSRKYVSYINN